MRLTSSPRMDVVKWEEKEDKLKAFLAPLFGATALAGAPAAVRLLARSPSSPVVKAYAAIVAACEHRPLRLRVILTTLDAAPGDSADLSHLLLASHLDVRLARNPRLHDAHEQLVLSDYASWIGDCLRREPAKRNAYECFAPDCALTAGWAGKSFEQLWRLSQPVRLPVRRTGNLAPNELANAGLPARAEAVAAMEDLAPSFVSTRH